MINIATTPIITIIKAVEPSPWTIVISLSSIFTILVFSYLFKFVTMLGSPLIYSVVVVVSPDEA